MLKVILAKISLFRYPPSLRLWWVSLPLEQIVAKLLTAAIRKIPLGLACIVLCINSDIYGINS